MMRIITGRAKGISLTTLDGENTRPTTERSKEAIFSMIQFDIEGRNVLDLFAGSGQMGLEALSRGAKEAVLVDHAKSAIEIIRKNTQKTRLEGTQIVCSDALEYLRSGNRQKKSFHIVFLDPPYSEKLIPKVLELLLCEKWLSENALIVCESRDDSDVFGSNSELAQSFDILKTKKHGISHINLLTPSKKEI